jgi:hypothetical protein
MPAMAVDTQDVRTQVFQLRAQGRSYSQIAAALGISKSRVQRELQKSAREVGDQVGELSGFHAGGDLGEPPPGGDPILGEQSRTLQAERLDYQRAQLRLQRAQLERQLLLIERPDQAGGTGALVSMLLQQQSQTRDELTRAIAQIAQRVAAPPPPSPPPPSLTDQLSQYRQMAETVASFAPPKAPNAATDLEFTVTKERLNMEQRRIDAELEAAAEERRERMASEIRRNDAVAEAIKQFAPTLSVAIEQWFQQRAQPAAAAPALPPAAPDGTSPPQLEVVQSNEVVGNCPHCGVQLAIAGGSDETCPNCHWTVLAVEGRVRTRLPNGDLAPLGA